MHLSSRYLAQLAEIVHYVLHMLKDFGKRHANFLMRDRKRKVARRAKKAVSTASASASVSESAASDPVSEPVSAESRVPREPNTENADGEQSVTADADMADARKAEVIELKGKGVHVCQKMNHMFGL